jgi:hypothetical protein
LQAVWASLYAKRIGVRIGPLPAGANAVYQKGSNEFVFKSSGYGVTYDQQAAMLHECVHAMTDIERTVARVVEEEAAAYVAQLIFLRRLLDGRSAQAAYGSRLEPHEALADDIAGRMLYTGSTWAVPIPDFLELQRLILLHPAYAHVSRSDFFPNNGI